MNPVLSIQGVRIPKPEEKPIYKHPESFEGDKVTIKFSP